MNFIQQSKHPKQHLTQQTTIFEMIFDSTSFSYFLQKYSKIILIKVITAIKNDPKAKEPR
jgi:hypothetical protein